MQYFNLFKNFQCDHCNQFKLTPPTDFSREGKKWRLLVRDKPSVQIPSLNNKESWTCLNCNKSYFRDTSRVVRVDKNELMTIVMFKIYNTIVIVNVTHPEFDCLHCLTTNNSQMFFL